MNDATRLTSAQAPWLDDQDVVAVLDALQAEGATARFVGGCVRNALIDAHASDLDVAVDRPPQETTRLIEAAGLRAVPTGVDHGTVTALTPERNDPIEVTSLRRDVETDGRRAVVAFTEDWVEDARRRDFTMNALYVGADGFVHDPLDEGLADLAARRVRFIGRAADRIREDALRILRYFRFKAWYGEGRAAEPQDLADVAALTDLIAGLARERIGQETRKLLAAADPTAAVALMVRTGAAAASFAPAPLRSSAVDDLRRLVDLERDAGAPPSALRRLAMLIDPEPKRATDLLRLAKPETRALERTRAARDMGPAEAGWRYGLETATDAALLNAAVAERVGGDAAHTLAAARRGAEARFPLTAGDLLAAGVPQGPRVGQALRGLEARWIAANFEIDTPELLEILRTEKGLLD